MWLTEKSIDIAKLLKETENKKTGACVYGDSNKRQGKW